MHSFSRMHCATDDMLNDQENQTPLKPVPGRKQTTPYPGKKTPAGILKPQAIGLSDRTNAQPGGPVADSPAAKDAGQFSGQTGAQEDRAEVRTLDQFSSAPTGSGSTSTILHSALSEGAEHCSGSGCSVEAVQSQLSAPAAPQLQCIPPTPISNANTLARQQGQLRGRVARVSLIRVLPEILLYPECRTIRLTVCHCDAVGGHSRRGGEEGQAASPRA